MPPPTTPSYSHSRRPIASLGHLAGYVLITAGIAAWGFHAQQAGLGNPPSGQLVDHSEAIKNYLLDILVDWALLYYCWSGVRNYGGTLATLSGGRWTSWKEVLIDVAIALPFWVLWELTAYGVHWLLGPSQARSVAALLPQTIPEILLWILVSLTAGFCEELQSRGYVQRQFYALSGNIIVAIFGQAILFGLMHSYQGVKQMVVITALGVLYGALAAWRRNVRANMIAHAWSDIWEGWLKQLLSA